MSYEKSILINMRNLVKQQFGHITVICREENAKNGATRWLCSCVCGSSKIILGNNLVRGFTKSCGCNRAKAIAKALTKQGLWKTPFYRVYKNMINRCYIESTPCYKDYGGRGIRVCDDWRNSIESFVEWCEGNGYRKGLQLDRVNNNGNYTPGNCRFATRKENANNKRKYKRKPKN